MISMQGLYKAKVKLFDGILIHFINPREKTSISPPQSAAVIHSCSHEAATCFNSGSQNHLQMNALRFYSGIKHKCRVSL